MRQKKQFGFVLLLIVLVLGGLFLLNARRQTSNKSFGEDNGFNENYLDTNEISSLIVPHHDLVKEKRAEAFYSIKDKVSPRTVILASPNHFNTGNGKIITASKDWRTSEGTIMADSQRIDMLLGSGQVVSQNTAFDGEHGISNLLGDIKRTFPNAKLLPLIIRQNVQEAEIHDLGRELVALCENDCLLIASVDFSHYQPGALAELHDSLSIRALANLDQDLIWRAEVDSNQSLALAQSFAVSYDTPRFNLFYNSNSGKIAGSRDAESTSYVMGWYERGEALAPITDEATFVIGGDAMFDRNIDYNFRGEKLPEVFDKFGDRVMAGMDISILNLEGPISPTPIPADNGHSMIFNFPPKTADVLSWLKLNAVSLANNHTFNNGKKGFENTIKVLKEKRITPIGNQETFDEDSTAYFEQGEVKVAVMAIDILATREDLTVHIKKEKLAGRKVIIMPHWGIEYEQIHSKDQERLAHSWIDAGADLVIGGHPHVVQDAEIYKNKPIFYSLGNLLFDQTFSKETQRGLIVAGKFKGDNLEIVLLPTKSEKFKPSLLTGSEKTQFLTNMRKYLKLQDANSGYGYDKIMISEQVSR